MKNLSVVILAAGQGTRMKSALPKVLHCVAGKPMLEHVIDTANEMAASSIHVVYGHGGDKVKDALAHKSVNWVHQDKQLGTGHAVQQVSTHLSDNELVLILYGDVPLISKDTLDALLATMQDTKLSVLTAIMPDPTGYGRILRNENSSAIERIVEQKDATDAEKKVTEINTGIIAASSKELKAWLSQLDNNNAQNEFYLTDVIGLAAQDGITIGSHTASDLLETAGVNDRLQLSVLERHKQQLIANELMRNGVTLIDPARLDVRGNISVGADTVIDANVTLCGEVTVGKNVKIGVGAYITNAVIDDDVEILPYTVIENARVGKATKLGPFARLRPGTELAEQVHIGNFVEIKNAKISAGSKVNHLSYVGDSDVGRNVNIGAGTITCNYDGANKHRTVIGDNVFVGSDTQLVAPVTVGNGATIGAGTTVTKDVADDTLVISRSPQKAIQGWQRPVKKK